MSGVWKAVGRAFVATSIVIVGAAVQGRQSKSPLEGKWTVVSIQREGKTFTEQQVVGNMSLDFRGTSLTLTGINGPGEQRCSFSVAESASPKRLDYAEPDGQKIGGIYDLRPGGELIVALPMRGGNRPTVFSSEPGSKSVVLTLRKDTK